MTGHRVVVVGGGFGGLNVVRALRRVKVEVTLVDRRNFHLFQPLLYQVATGGLSPANIAAPFRSILRRQKNCQIRLGEVKGFDLANHKVLLADGELPYDSLVVAAGSRTSYFGNDLWAVDAPGLKSIEDALDIRRRVLSAFEAADRETDPARKQAQLTFVIVGAGPTGVELAGTLAEIADYTLKHEFRHPQSYEARILLVDMSPRPLSTFPESLSEETRKQLEKRGIELRPNTRVTQVNADGITLQVGTHTEDIAAETVLWAAGVAASPLGKLLAEQSGAPLDRQGRVQVQSDLTLPGHSNVFVIGDLANYIGEDGKSLPGVAPVAMQQGTHVAETIMARFQHKTVKPFRYFDYGSMATIGRNAAVAKLGKYEFRGFIAWLMWLFIHLIQIVQFDNRVMILFQWAWNYITFNRSARLITDVGGDSAPAVHPAQNPPTLQVPMTPTVGV